MARQWIGLLLLMQTIGLSAVIPWSWLVTDGAAGAASRANALLLGAGVYLLQGGLAAAVVLLSRPGREGSTRAWLVGAVSTLLALGPWVVVELWWREPFSQLTRQPRVASVAALTLAVVVVLGVALAKWARHRWPGWARRAAVLQIGIAVFTVLAGSVVWIDRPASAGEANGNLAPPNVVLYIVDAMRRDVVEPHGGPEGLTPGFAALAREGISFDGAIANAPISIPGHASILSGRGVEGHGAFTNHHSLERMHDGLAERLRARGYHTVGVCSNQLIGRSSGFTEGFDLYWSTGQSRVAGAPVPLGLLDVPMIRFALEVAGTDLAKLSADLVIERLPQPFFLFLQVLHTHVPYQDREGWATPERVSKLTEEYRSGARQNTTGYPDQELAFFHAQYLGSVHTADALFTHWRERLDKVYGATKTRWIVTADHGENLGEHGRAMVGEHEGPFNTSLRIPLLSDTADPAASGMRVDALTAQDRIASLAEWLATPTSSAAALLDSMSLAVHFALTDSAYVLFDDSLKVVWSRERPELEPSYHCWREDPLDRLGRPVSESVRASELVDQLVDFVETADLAARIETTETLDEDRLRALRALGYIK